MLTVTPRFVTSPYIQGLSPYFYNNGMHLLQEGERTNVYSVLQYNGILSRIDSLLRRRPARAKTMTFAHLGPVSWNCLLIGCLTSQQQASVSQGRICTDNFTCCHTEIEAADQTFHLTQSQYTDTGPTSPSADPITPGAWQGSHWSANV